MMHDPFQQRRTCRSPFTCSILQLVPAGRSPKPSFMSCCCGAQRRPCKDRHLRCCSSNRPKASQSSDRVAWPEAQRKASK